MRFLRIHLDEGSAEGIGLWMTLESIDGTDQVAVMVSYGLD